MYLIEIGITRIKRCRDCPECAVIFDSEGIHGHVPDRNSKTCQSCERYKGASQ